mgnify:FL=1
MACSNCKAEKLEQRNSPTRDAFAAGKVGDTEFQDSVRNFTETVNHYRSNGVSIQGTSYSLCTNCGTVTG